MFLILLCIAVFLSTVGNTTLIIAIATDIYHKTDSVTIASTIYSSQWLFPIVLSPIATYLCYKFQPKFLLLWAELAACCFVVFIGYLYYENPYLTLIFLVIRGFIDILVKSVRVIMVKLYYESKGLENAFTTISGGFILGAGVAGLLASLLIARYNIFQISFISAFLILLACIIYSVLIYLVRNLKVPVFANPKEKFFTRIRNALKSNDLILKNLILIFTVVGFYQGYHTLARTPFAIDFLGLKETGPAWIQVIAILGICAGAIIIWLLTYKKYKWKLLGPVTFFAAAFTMLLTWVSKIPEISFLFYFLFMLFYEMAFLLFNKNLVVLCPREHMPIISILINAGSLALMTILVTLGSLIADASNLFISTSLMAVTAIGIYVLVNKNIKKTV